MSDPFAETPVPWWRRLRREDRSQHTPKKIARVLGGTSALAVYALPHHHHSLVMAFIAALVLGAPAMVVERRYKQRHRRKEEQLFVLPEGSHVTTRVIIR